MGIHTTPLTVCSWCINTLSLAVFGAGNALVAKVTCQANIDPCFGVNYANVDRSAADACVCAFPKQGMLWACCAAQSVDAATTFCLASEDPSNSGDMMTDSLLETCALDSVPLLAFGVRAPDLACYHSSERFHTGECHTCFALQCAFQSLPCLAAWQCATQHGCKVTVVCFAAVMPVCANDMMT